MSIIRASKNDVKHLITLIQNRFGNVDNTADANKNVASAAKWTTARNINGMTVDGSANRTNYGTCSTAAATAAKTVACTGFALVTGAEITVKFTVTNTAFSPTLNVNGTGAKAIYYRGSAITAGYLAANRTYTFRYNGTQYDLVGDVDTNSTYSAAGTSLGLVKSGGDVTISNGTITVNDDSHNHTIGNVDGLQTALDGKLGTTATAAAATKLANARDINLSGDASGSASFNGTQDVTISVTVKDDSHSHTIANVDNLQTTLNGKATQTQIRDVKEATLTSAGWSGSGPYTQSVTVTGISASDTPLIECIADVNSASEKRLMQQQWNKVDYIECAANKITATCNFDKPTVNLSLRIKGI